MSPGGHRHRGNAAGRRGAPEHQLCMHCSRCDGTFGPFGEWPEACPNPDCDGTDEAGDFEEVRCPPPNRRSAER
jgi:hypothetical protein